MSVITLNGFPAMEAPAWDGTAYSVPVLSGDGRFWFTVPKTTIGAVVGLDTNPVVGGDYSGIDCAFEFNNGMACVRERGVRVTMPTPYTDTDVFTIMRYNGAVFYLVGSAGQPYADSRFPFYLAGDVLHSSDNYPESCVLAACLYAIADSVSAAGYSSVPYAYVESGRPVTDDILNPEDTGTTPPRAGYAFGSQALDGFASNVAYASIEIDFKMDGYATGERQLLGGGGAMVFDGFASSGAYAAAVGSMGMDGRAQSGLQQISFTYAIGYMRQEGFASGYLGANLQVTFGMTGFASAGAYAEAVGDMGMEGYAMGHVTVLSGADVAMPAIDAIALTVDEITVYSGGLGGRVVKVDGGSDGIEVIVREYYTHVHIASPVVSSMGMWSADLIPGTYDITYRAPNYAPINHGPYTVL